MESTRKCLVCGAPTTSVHYGVDACRACTVFYRKARKKKPYLCRSDSSRCNVPQGNCSGKRFMRVAIIKMLIYTTFKTVSSHASAVDSIGLSDLFDRPLNLRICYSTGLSLIERLTIDDTQPVLLNNCAVYKMMCAMRRNGELNARPNPPDISKMHAEDYEIVPVTYKIWNSSSRFTITAILDFADAMFPEFASFSEDERRTFLFTSASHAEKVFPDDMSKGLGMYTAYMSFDVVEHFFDDCENPNANIDEAKKVLKTWISKILPSSRIDVRRANLDDREFHAVLVLSFWIGGKFLPNLVWQHWGTISAECEQMGDTIESIAVGYKTQVLRELQAYYRSQKLDDFAARLGELFMLIFNMERGAEDCNENFEIYRMLGVFDEETFAYRMHQQSK